MKADYSKTAGKEIPIEPSSIEPSIQEQILWEMLEGLKDRPEFPPELIERLQNFGERNQLQKFAEVSKLIKSSNGASNAAN